MRTHRLRRAASVVSIVAAFGVAAACTPTPPAQPQGNIQIKANTLTVVSDNNDCFGLCLYDEPYLVNLNFRAWFNHPGSASTFLVHNISNELFCPGGPAPFLGSNVGCSEGESTGVPSSMGLNRFPNVKLVDVADLLLGRQPEIAGTVSFAYEEDQIFGSGNVAGIVGSFADALRTVLNATVSAGSLPADENAAAALIVSVIGSVFGAFANSLAGLFLGLGNADDLIGIAPIVVVGISGTLASLANLAGLNGTPIANGKVFTFAGGNTNVRYHEQNLGGFTVGDVDGDYRVNWTVGPY